MFANQRPSPMAESKPRSTQPSSDTEVKAPNLIERTKEEIEAMLHHTDESNHPHKETHGLREDIDEKTPLEEVKAPNVFERVKEEFEAVQEAIHSKKESDPTLEIKTQAKADSKSENNGKSPRFLDYAKGKIKTFMHHDKSPKLHNKETHGTSDDIDNTTPLDRVKAPNVFERAKEEIEAIVQTVHPKNEEKSPVSSPKTKEGGLVVSIGKGLEKVCSPCSNKGGLGESIGKGLEKVCSPRSNKKD